MSKLQQFWSWLRGWGLVWFPGWVWGLLGAGLVGLGLYCYPGQLTVLALWGLLLWRRPRLAWGLAGAWALGCLWLGWRLPWFDQHPSWPEFPQQTNPCLVIEHVPDFGQRYGRRFRLPPPKPGKPKRDFAGYLRPNLQALGYRITGNDFESAYHPFTWGSGNSTGQKNDPPIKTRFENGGYSYFKLRLGSNTGKFKYKFYAMRTVEKDFFFQYNNKIEDTLYFHNLLTDWRVYLRCPPAPTVQRGISR